MTIATFLARLFLVSIGLGLCYLAYILETPTGAHWICWVFGLTGIQFICWGFYSSKKDDVKEGE